ncbi:MAG: hypothetical protein QOI95_304 [Acidimicrobiaceae bacterium]|jgi:predicted O-methyltransferase YrrM
MNKAELRLAWRAARSNSRAFGRAMLKQPFIISAGRRVAELPRRELSDLVATGERRVVLSAPQSRHAWSLGAAEQVVLQLLISDRNVHTAFEFGTFNGATTALIAEALPDEGRVVTVDLPDTDFRATQHPDAFSAQDVGAVHRASVAKHKVQQLRVDSLVLDTTPWRAWADLVLVDGGHDYEHGFADTRSALAIVKPGGIVLWDDFDPYWHGLINGILDAAAGRPVERLAGLPLAILLVN